MSTSSVTVPRSRPGWLARLLDYVELSKPRIGLSVLITAAVAYVVACAGRPNVLAMVGMLAGTVAIAASASALNQWLERSRDALMERTANRPLPAARLSSSEALSFAGIMLVLGAAQLYLAAGRQPVAWAGLSWLLYVLVYTPIKVRTPLNTAVGALAGAMPTLIGWSAAGVPFDLRAAPLYLVLLLWQFPHFMAIAWMYRRQYARAGMQMLPVVDPTGRLAGWYAVVGAAALVPVSLAPAVAMPTASSLLYLPVALLSGSAHLAFALAFLFRPDDRAARRLLRASLAHLAALFVALGSALWVP